MSAYAMPGAFPPLSGFASTYNVIAESSDFHPHHPVRHPQHCESLTPPLQFKPISFLSIRSTPISPNSPLTPPSLKNAGKDEMDEDDALMSREVGIMVKEAKIDVAQLVKSLTTSSKNRKRDILPTTTPPAPSTQSDDRKSRKDQDDDPHKEAIQFELSISFNGRTYSATRTLRNIVQLRDDLIEEINNRRRALHDRRLRWTQKGSPRNLKLPHTGNGINLDNDDDDETVKTIEEDETLDVSIPEIPDYYSSDDKGVGTSFAGRGFTLLQALLRSYCPAMEGWLRKVTLLVPPMDSPSLSQFLWEPVSGEVKMPANSSNHSFSTLVSIREDDEIDDDEEFHESASGLLPTM